MVYKYFNVESKIEVNRGIFKWRLFVEEEISFEY